MYIRIDGIDHEVIVTRKRSNRNTYLRVKEDLKLYVTTNSFVSDRAIKKIIEENVASIRAMYQKQAHKNDLNDRFFYLGKEYDIVWTNSDTVMLGHDKVFLGKNVDLDRWYRKNANSLFLEHFNACYEQYTRRIPYPTLKIRKMKSRWGVCNTKTRSVTLNLELMKKDLECLDYVIFHELSHLIEGNHSPRFWKLVEENFPNYKEVRKRMKNY